MRVEYFRNGWEVSFSLKDSSPAAILGLVAFPHEVVLQATSNDGIPSDAETARVLVSCTEHTVQSVSVGESASLTISFSNGATAQFPGVAGPVDEVWSVYSSAYANRRRKFGEDCFMQSYFGELSADNSFIAFSTAP